ncbi:MAG: CPBP family intramembrane metalloprotease [Prevotella sp.]|jgi:membrane protease YdiL (CAAX protease family)|nr:CPBP family intramembrane metalloprotease [Prevotella sp.]
MFDIVTFKDVININHSKFILYLAVAFMVGLNEEILFRGSIMMYIKYLINTKVALGISSILFSLVHFHYNGLLPFITVFLAGIIFSILTLKYKSLLPAIGFHMGWDFSYFIFEDIFDVTKSIPLWGEIFEIPQIIFLAIILCILIYTCQKHVFNEN